MRRLFRKTTKIISTAWTIASLEETLCAHAILLVLGALVN